MNRKYISKLICSVIFIALVTFAYAQVPVIVKSTERAKINGKIYYVHIVKKGETLYSLARVYEVTIDQLTQDNPELANGLKEGQSLKILASSLGTAPDTTPVVHAPATVVPAATPATKPSTVTSEAKSVSETKTTVSDSEAENQSVKRPFYHEVKQGETLWNIARRYEVTVDDMRRYNPEALATDDLMVGVLLRLPPPSLGTQAVTKPAALAEEFPSDHFLNPPTDALDKDPVLLSRPIQAALMLPLLVYPKSADTVVVNTAITRLRSAENYYSFYEGALLAIEELKRQGLSLDLSVYDTYNEQTIKDLLAKNTLAGEDIVIGPVYTVNFRPVAQFAKEYRVKIVSPLDPNTEVLTLENPNMFQVSPPYYCRQKKLIDNLLSRHQSNIIMVYEEGSRDSILVESYKNLIGDRIKNITLLPYKVAKNNTSIRASLTNMIVAGTENCVLVASNNEALVADVAANLYLLTFRQRYLITLYGTERWRGFETVDLKYFHALNLHIVVPFFIDYENENVKKFVARFQDTYKADPSQYAFQGYDTFYYFLQAIMLYGKDFEKYLPEYKPKLLQTNYVFKYNESYNNGLVNVESCLLNYTPEYTIVKR